MQGEDSVVEIFYTWINIGAIKPKEKEWKILLAEALEYAKQVAKNQGVN